ncbi:MAG: type III pantothenate kinase [Oscillospiraceae bacterium]|nr:type III pantothenate kinase [Oscillospiraceae bacterium]
MILTIDIGNANIILAGEDNGKCALTCRLSTSKTRTSDEYAMFFEQLAHRQGIDLAAAEGAIIASVVPQVTSTISLAMTKCTGKKPIVIGPGVKSGLNIRIDDPAELGADLVAAAVGAMTSYPLPCIATDMSTATAIGVIDGRGGYIGGLICPGVVMSQRSLEQGASRLPGISLEPPKNVIGKTTSAAMRSGLIYGSASMIDGVIDRVEAELGQKATVVATGYWAGTIVPYCLHSGIIIDDDLVMKGLASIYRRNT